MKTLKEIACIVTICLLATTAFGQKNKADRKAHKEKIQAMKVGYITEKLDLKAAEAEKFWPIYNEYDAKMDETRKSIRRLHKNDATIDEMTDAEVEQMITKHNNARQKELDLMNEYHARFKAILPIKKVAKLYTAEQGFKRELLKKLRVKKGEKNSLNIPPPPPLTEPNIPHTPPNGRH